MSSGFISEAELAEQRRIRQEEWDKVRKPDDPEERPEEPYDPRSLFERLEEQKQKRELEYEEAHRLKNMIKGLDDDEVEFLDLVDRSKLEEEKRKSDEEAREIKDFRNAVASLQEKSLEERINIEIRPKPLAHPTSTASNRTSQLKLLAGAVVRKRPADAAPSIESPRKKQNTKDEVNNFDETASPEKMVTEPSISEEHRMSCKRKLEEEDIKSGSFGFASGLRCIGILPGLGLYDDSSDSDQSSDTDQELPCNSGYDLCGRKVTATTKTAKASSNR
ncbi:PSME3-interacting protein isoform X1 [Anabrus simplex]|uniref:PSME3-interacting protein isoform X1 n=1 Tax=Anabrus simplex TaxID=316456 RepID=UPI0035A39DB6